MTDGKVNESLVTDTQCAQRQSYRKVWIVAFYKVWLTFLLNTTAPCLCRLETSTRVEASTIKLFYIQGVPREMCQTSEECSVC